MRNHLLCLEVDNHKQQDKLHIYKPLNNYLQHDEDQQTNITFKLSIPDVCIIFGSCYLLDIFFPNFWWTPFGNHIVLGKSLKNLTASPCLDFAEISYLLQNLKIGPNSLLPLLLTKNNLLVLHLIIENIKKTSILGYLYCGFYRIFFKTVIFCL